MKLVETLKGRVFETPPVWIMRQAGRYLPEFRALRKQAPEFMNFCRHADLVAEVTLQPLKRFDFDAAIIFSDILMVPHALGQSVRFVSGEGPQLTPLTRDEDLNRLSSHLDSAAIEPTLEAIKHVRATLPRDKALIGFAGAPWTVMTYMIEGQGSKGKGHGQTLSLFFENPALFKRLQDRVVEATVAYLCAQADAGVNVLKIFDSWAGSVPAPFQEALVFAPLRSIASRVRAAYPSIPLILFPKGLSVHQLGLLKDSVDVSAFACDQTDLPSTLTSIFPQDFPLQTGPHPELLRIGGEPLLRETKAILDAFSGRPFVMNLSHGILPTTPIANVDAFLDVVRSHSQRTAA